MKDYKLESDGATIGVKPNVGDARANDLYIGIVDEDDAVCIGISGKNQIARFIYAAAVHGGLILDGDSLTMRKPLSKEIPADGAYLLNEGFMACHVLVTDGKLYVLQDKSKVMLDRTEEYLEREDWVLEPMVTRDA